MDKETVIYTRQSDGPPRPVTVRLEWLPDGTIRPLLYWTSDGTCFQVLSVSHAVALAFLKDRGEGLRFKVQAEIIETDEPDPDLLYTRQETYLYLADHRFSEKNIIDGRYGHPGKEYIPVTLDVFPDGDYELLSFQVRGQRWAVEETELVEPRGSFRAGGVGLRHKVEARLMGAEDEEDPDPDHSVRRAAALYWELNKWFVHVTA